MLIRICLCDALTGKELCELGFFRPQFAADFLEEWRQQSAENPHETRVAVAEKIPQNQAA